MRGSAANGVAAVCVAAPIRDGTGGGLRGDDDVLCIAVLRQGGCASLARPETELDMHGSGSSVGGGGGGCDGRAAAAAAAVALEVKRVDVKRKEPAFCSFFACVCKPQIPPSVCPLPPDCGADEYPPVRSLYVGRHIETPLVEC